MSAPAAVAVAASREHRADGCGHDWRIVAPWYRWALADGSDPLRAADAARPAFHKYVSTAFVADFLNDPQRSVVFDPSIDVLHQDFVRTARAKGIPERRILLHHTVRNALLPMITVAGLQLPNLLGGALVTETVFTWPGMGRLFLDSISYRDYPVVMGILMFTAVLVLLGSLMADLLYGVADPRLRLK